MAYENGSFDYDEGDVAPVAFDAIVTAVLTVSSFISLIILILLYRWFRKNVPRM